MTTTKRQAFVWLTIWKTMSSWMRLIFFISIYLCFSITFYFLPSWPPTRPTCGWCTHTHTDTHQMINLFALIKDGRRPIINYSCLLSIVFGQCLVAISWIWMFCWMAAGLDTPFLWCKLKFIRFVLEKIHTAISI